MLKSPPYAGRHVFSPANKPVSDTLLIDEFMNERVLGAATERSDQSLSDDQITKTYKTLFDAYRSAVYSLRDPTEHMKSEYRRLKSAAPREQTLSLLIYHQSLTQAHLSTLKQDLATAKASLKSLREQLLTAER